MASVTELSVARPKAWRSARFADAITTVASASGARTATLSHQLADWAGTSGEPSAAMGAAFDAAVTAVYDDATIVGMLGPSHTPMTTPHTTPSTTPAPTPPSTPPRASSSSSAASGASASSPAAKADMRWLKENGMRVDAIVAPSPAEQLPAQATADLAWLRSQGHAVDSVSGSFYGTRVAPTASASHTTGFATETRKAAQASADLAWLEKQGMQVETAQPIGGFSTDKDPMKDVTNVAATPNKAKNLRMLKGAAIGIAAGASVAKAAGVEAGFDGGAAAAALGKAVRGGWDGVAVDWKTAGLKIRAITWNMHGKTPKAADIQALREELFLPGQRDVYVVGSQESCATMQKSVINSSKKEWEHAIELALGDGYVMQGTRVLQAIHLAVFVRAALVPWTSNRRSASVATGVGGFGGNKGGVACSMCIADTSFLFVSCHFAAHQGNWSERNANFAKVNSKLPLHPQPIAVGEDGRLQELSSDASSRFDVAVWLGDFNYRIDEERAKCIELIEAKDWAALKAKDQLVAQKAAGAVFKGFGEGELGFAPTYKFDANTDTYDTSKKKRIPAWTDRVLWKGNDAKKNLKLQGYGSVGALKMSDHRPVFADLEVQLSSENSYSDGDDGSQACLIM